MSKSLFVVGGALFDLDGAVDLLEEDEAGELVGKGKRREADGVAGGRENLLRKPLGAADHEGEAGGAFFPF